MNHLLNKSLKSNPINTMNSNYKQNNYIQVCNHRLNQKKMHIRMLLYYNNNINLQCKQFNRLLDCRVNFNNQCSLKYKDRDHKQINMYCQPIYNCIVMMLNSLICLPIFRILQNTQQFQKLPSITIYLYRNNKPRLYFLYMLFNLALYQYNCKSLQSKLEFYNGYLHYQKHMLHQSRCQHIKLD